MNFVIQPLAAISEILAERMAAKQLMVKLSDNLRNTQQEVGEDVLFIDQMSPVVELNQVSYNHLNGKQGLKGITLTLFPGKSYAIVGSFDSGKFTLLNLLMKSHREYSGE